MFPVRTKFWYPMGMLVLSLAASPATKADWLDDFNDGSTTDGNPVTWLEDLGGIGIFPGTYTASNPTYPGDYYMLPDVGSPSGFCVSLVPSEDFTDVYMRTQGIIVPDPNDPLVNFSGNLALLARVSTATLDAYVLYVDAGGTLQLQKSIAGTPEDFEDVTSGFQLDFNGASEVIIELNVIGNQLSGFAWQPGQEKPATPQVTAIDDGDLGVGAYTSGVSGLAYAEDDPNTAGVFRFAAAQDNPFMDEPPPLDGDYNGDGTVNAADYTVWRDGGSPDDTQAGYELWAANFGNSGAGSGGAAAVPEPAGLAWILLALSGAACVGGRKLSGQ